MSNFKEYLDEMLNEDKKADYFQKFKDKMDKDTSEEIAMDWVDGIDKTILNNKEKEELKKMIGDYLKK